MDLDGDGVPDEVQETAEALWEVHDLLYGTFDFYAALSDRDPFTISQKAWSLFVSDFNLEEARSKLCTKSHLDQLFVASDTNADEIVPLAKGAVKQAGSQTLNRQEFLQVIVRVAVTKHVLTSRATDDVSDAVSMLVRRDLAPRVPRECEQDSNAFRRRQCYTEAVDAALRAHEPSLRVLYRQYAAGQGLVKATEADRQAASRELLGLDEWRKFVTDLRLMDHVLTPRLVTLVFVWSRMRVVDEVKRRVRLTNHHFEDFLESLVRVAVIKPWPSAEEIRQAGCLDAGHFIIKLQSELAAQEGTEAVGGTGKEPRTCYDEWCEARRRPSYDSEPELPVAVCVAQLLSYIFNVIEGSTHSAGAHDLNISQREASLFYNNGIGTNAVAAARPELLLQRVEQSRARPLRTQGR